MEEDITGETDLCGDFGVVSLLFSLKRTSGAKDMSLLLENIRKMKRNQLAQRNCSSQREWRDLHIQSEAAGKELQRDYANPRLGERWLIARAGGCTHCSVPGQWLCKLHTHSQSAGQLAKWEKLWLCISKCAAFSTQMITPRSVQNKHERTPLPPLAPLRGIPLTFGCWSGNRTSLSSRSECLDAHFQLLWVWHQRDKKMEARMKTSPCFPQFSDPREILLVAKERMHLQSGWAQPLSLHYAWERSGGMGDVIKMSDF